MHARSVIVPNIDGVLTFGRDPCARHIRCLTDFEKRQTVAGFQGTSLAIKSNAEFDNRPFIFPQRITDQSDFRHVRFEFLWRRRSLAQIFALYWPEQVTPP